MKKSLFTVATVFLSMAMQAKVTPADIFGDNMVLQRESEVAVWGWAEPKSEVRIETDWNASVSARAGRDGRWSTTLRTPSAGGPYSIRFNDGEETVIGNVLIGEVWFCSGQSNMVMPVRGFRNQPVTGADELIMDADPAVPLRFCAVGRNAVAEPQDKAKIVWKENNPGNVSGAVAVAYVFGKYLQSSLGVPVGLVCSSWGGSPIEAWMERSLVVSVNKDYKEGNDTPAYKQAQNLYNGMVAPLVPFTFKGLIWYQGEANVNRYTSYQALMENYVAMMRDKFCNPSLPVYSVQIAPYKYRGVERIEAAMLMEAQYKASVNVPGCGLVTTVDCGEKDVIHPAAKVTVGKRLAIQALVKTYGMKGIEADAPHYESVEFEKGIAVVKLSKSNNGINPLWTPLEGFELAGADKVFHPANAVVKQVKNSKNCYVKVWSDEVTEPVAVRYCFRNWSRGNLYNAFGIPVGPFRSDDWEQ